MFRRPTLHCPSLHGGMNNVKAREAIVGRAEHAFFKSQKRHGKVRSKDRFTGVNVSSTWLSLSQLGHWVELDLALNECLC